MRKRHPRHSVPTGAMSRALVLVAMPAQRMGPTGALARARVLAGLVALLVVVCACDSRRKGALALDECEEYARVARACFGPRAASNVSTWLSRPIENEAARAAMRDRCSAQTAKMGMICRAR